MVREMLVVWGSSWTLSFSSWTQWVAYRLSLLHYMYGGVRSVVGS